MPIKPLTFKGDKKPKKRKHRSLEDSTNDDTSHSQSHSQSLVPNNNNDNTSSSTHQANANADPSEDDTWTTPDSPSDVSGPILIVLPTTPATCLASDAHGNVFASRLENIVDDYAETAEPHDVRQVWVASSIAGTGQIHLRGSHGGYLACDSIGVLGARREARGVEEGFVVEEVGSNAENNGSLRQEGGGGGGGGKVRWRLRTFATKIADGEKGRRYLCANVVGGGAGAGAGAVAGKGGDDGDSDDDDGEKKKKKTIAISLRGDGEADSETTHLVLKMQARFKPRVQLNKETKASQKISRRELEQAVGRKLDDQEVKRLKRAKKEGTYYEEVLDVRVKGKHDKFAS